MFRSRWDLTPEVRKTITSDLIRMYESDKKSVHTISKELRMSATTIRRLFKAVGFNVVIGNRPSARIRYECEWCKKEFWRIPAAVGKWAFCSHRCYGEWRVGKYAGENCGKWKGGVTPLQIKQLATKEWYALVREIRRKYKNCFLCGSDEKLHVHHIVPRRTSLKLMYDEDNLAVLCASCHRGIKGKEEEYEDTLREYKVLQTNGGPLA